MRHITTRPLLQCVFLLLRGRTKAQIQVRWLVWIHKAVKGGAQVWIWSLGLLPHRVTLQKPWKLAGTQWKVFIRNHGSMAGRKGCQSRGEGGTRNLKNCPPLGASVKVGFEVSPGWRSPLNLRLCDSKSSHQCVSGGGRRGVRREHC